MATIQNNIRDKYKELIRLMSLISDDVRIEDKWSALSLTIHIYTNNRELMSFKLSETSDMLNIEWGVLYKNIGHWCFPNYFDQRYMFKTLISVITDWYHDVINSNIDKVLEQAQDKVNNKDITSENK